MIILIRSADFSGQIAYDPTQQLLGEIIYMTVKEVVTDNLIHLRPSHS